MNFKPKTENELRSEMILPDGEYDFEVMDAKDTTSKTKGNEMIALNMKLFAPDGTTPYIRDWLVNSDHPLCQMKIRHFAQATNKMAEYEAGTLSAMDCEGACGRVKVGSREQEGFGLQNSIEDYVWDKDQESQDAAPTYTAPASVIKKLNAELAEDEFPF
jgi:hypothetical protein